MSKRKTHEELVKELRILKPHITVLGHYKNALDPIQCQCNICGHTWPAIPNNILRNKNGCANCAGNLKKTTEVFIREVQDKNPTIEVIGEYVDNKTNIKCRSTICGHEWDAAPSSLLGGHGCDICARRELGERRRKNNEDFLAELAVKNPKVIPLEEYVDYNTPIRCKCPCGNDSWYVSPGNLLDSKLCSKCSGERTSKTQRKRWADGYYNLDDRKSIKKQMNTMLWNWHRRTQT